MLRKGLSPLATTLSTPSAAPVVAGIRLRAGKAGSGKGAASMVTEAISTARAAVSGCEILVRGDSSFGNSHVVAAARTGGARFSVVLNKTRAVNRAIAAIDQDAWTPVHYPGAVEDPDTGELIFNAEVAEIIDGPLAHLPSGSFAANSAWAICAAMAHNLLRAAATLTCNPVARGATLRGQLINVPARLVPPQRRPILRLPTHWPWAQPWLTLWHNIFRTRHGPLTAA